MKFDAPLIIHTESSYAWGGQEIRISEELKGMRQLGFSTALICPRQSQIFKRAQSQGLTIYPVSSFRKTALSSWSSVFRLIRRLGPTVVNTHSSDDTWIAGLISRLLRVPLIIRTRHVSTPIGSTFSYRYFPHLIITTSAAIRADLVERGLDDQKIIEIPTGVDLKRFKFSPQDRTRMRNSLGLSNSDILVGNICVLRSWKGLDFFVDTAATMAAPFKFILVGDGPQRQRLQDKVRSMKLTDRFILAGHQERVEHFFSALDIFFFTSYASEGIPQSLLQAISMGLPLVVCRTPSVLEALQNVNGCIEINYGDLEAARRSIVLLSQRLDRDEHKILSTRQAIESRYGLENMWDSLVAAYQTHGVLPIGLG
jgi:glycosyltransferase involved in cell wall biosynthesis